MNLSVSGFDWDDGNKEKCRKHGVSIAEIESVFSGDLRIAPDPKHSTDEDRFIAIGTTSAGRHMFVAFTRRIRDKRRLIRPVTARYMNGREIAAYEKESAEAQDR